MQKGLKLSNAIPKKDGIIFYNPALVGFDFPSYTCNNTRGSPMNSSLTTTGNSTILSGLAHRTAFNARGWYARSITPAFNFSNTSLTNFLVKKASWGVTLQSSSVTLQHSSATFQLSNVMLQGSRGAFESSNVILQGSSATFQRSSVMPQCSGVAFQSSNVTPQRSNATFERSSVAAQPCKYSKNHSLTTKKP